jgi:hypothetical protein
VLTIETDPLWPARSREALTRPVSVMDREVRCLAQSAGQARYEPILLTYSRNLRRELLRRALSERSAWPKDGNPTPGQSLTAAANLGDLSHATVEGTGQP